MSDPAAWLGPGAEKNTFEQYTTNNELLGLIKCDDPLDGANWTRCWSGLQPGTDELLHKRVPVALSLGLATQAKTVNKFS